jgi:uncharacterized protein
MGILRFQWDPEKSRINRNKHGISFDEAATAFGDPIAITIDDVDHSDAEDRYVTIGSTRRHIVVIICHTDRAGFIRIISARKANKHEREQYYAS